MKRPPTNPSTDRTPVAPDLIDDLAVARLAAQRAGTLIADAWRDGAAVRFKGPIDPVTDTDLAAERAITGLIGDRFPEDRIIAEEGGVSGPDGSRRWLIDPLDGTTNFTHRLPHFCVSIACADADGLRVGVIVEPLRGWTFEAVRGAGAWLDGRALRVSATERLDRAVIATGFPHDRHTALDNNSHRFAAVLRTAQGLRRGGSAALDLAFVAAGWLDGYWERQLQPWDLAAGALLVREAGGTLSDLAGGRWQLDDGEIQATNGPLHPKLRDVLVTSDAAFAHPLRPVEIPTE